MVGSLGHCGISLAAPPTIKYLFPPGGQRGHTVDAKAKGDLANWPVKTWCSDPNIQITCGEDQGTLHVAVAPSTPPGLCWIRLHDDEGASRPLPFLVGNLPEVNESADNDSPATAEAVPSSSQVINGRLEKRDDVDVYAVELTAGQTLVASVRANEVLASPMDAVLQLLTSNGSVAAQNHDWQGLDPQIVFTAPAAGKYLVRIFAFPSQPDSRIGLAGGDDYLYRLTVTTGPFVDYTWPLAIEKDKPSDVESIGWNINDSLKRQQVSTSSDSAPLNGEQLCGRLAVSADPHRCLIENETGSQDQPQAIELPLTISGKLPPQDEADRYRFHAKHGETVAFRLDARVLGSPLDAVLAIRDLKGKSLARTDDTSERRDPELTWKVPQDGEFDLEVADLSRQGDERFFYRLQAGLATPDFQIHAKDHAFVGEVGKPISIELEVDRRHGFDKEIEFRVEGLPEGASCEPARSTPSGDSAKKVTLIITANVPFSSPLLIHAKSSGDQPLEHAVTFQPTSGFELPNLWVAVRPETKK
jgi:hypothetical protein